MKANLPKLEPEWLERWAAMDIYGRIRQASASRPLWILHDGPPYANGHIHMGHRAQQDPQGPRREVALHARATTRSTCPGWDCHGLPIEHQVDKELGLDQASVDVRQAMDPLEKRRRCREYATQVHRHPARGVPAPRASSATGTIPYLHDGARLPGDDRARVRPLRRARPRATRGSSPCTGACTARPRWPRPRWSTRTRRTPSVYVKFPLKAPAPAPGRARRSTGLARDLDHDAVDAAREPRHRGPPRARSTPRSSSTAQALVVAQPLRRGVPRACPA